MNDKSSLLETKRMALELDSVELDGSFSGYASLFGVVDLGNDVMDTGAFKRSLERRHASGIRMLWQHEAREPIGIWTTIREDAQGLYVEGRLAKGVARARETLELLRSKAIDGLSVGFRTIKARKDARTGVRHIAEADLWEISVVTFPMQPAARIGQVKSGTLPTIREFERWLTRDAGLSRHEARTVIAKGFATLAQKFRPEEPREAFSQHNQSMAQRLREATHYFR
ncbi:HK97 family phage prohead protease [Brucellaceae bacterium C25G]